jgi:hypothetical protein
MMTNVVHSFEMSVDFYPITNCYIPDGSILYESLAYAYK